MNKNEMLLNPWDLIDELADEDTKENFELDDLLVNISVKIINYRIENDLSQKELAKKLNVTQAMVSKLESGEYNPTVELLWKISKKLGWKFEVILEKKTKQEVWDTDYNQNNIIFTFDKDTNYTLGVDAM